MRILLLADRSSIHTVRWANSLAEYGQEIHLASCHDGGDPLSEKIIYHSFSGSTPYCYYLAARQLKDLIISIQPDLLHAHYASGYGTLARLVDFHPFILSVWGSDVYEFPYRSRLHKHVIQKNLEAADYVCSTSHVMAKQSQKLSSRIRDLRVISFGIDTMMFTASNTSLKQTSITIGTVKTLANKYGIDTLIRAFSRARELVRKKDQNAAQLMNLLLVGGGETRDELTALVKSLGLEEVTTFTGLVPHQQVPDFLHKLDIYVALSRCGESFGVAILEASASGLPVVVSDMGGLPEVVVRGTTGFIVKPEDVEGAAQAIAQLALDSQLRKHFGKAGRTHVLEKYDWHSNVAQMVGVYQEALENDTAIK